MNDHKVNLIPLYTQISRQENESMVTFLTLTRHFFLHTTPIDVINSWGISKMYATQIVKNVNGEDFTMAALVMQVNGFLFQAIHSEQTCPSS